MVKSILTSNIAYKNIYLFNNPIKSFSKKKKLDSAIRGQGDRIRNKILETFKSQERKIEEFSNYLIPTTSIPNININTCVKNSNSSSFIAFYKIENDKNNEITQTNKSALEKFHEDKIIIQNTNSHLETIAEIKPDLYTILKIVRMFSMYILIPYNSIYALYFESYTLDTIVSHLSTSIGLFLLPYIFTENFVINMKYDRKREKVHITKMNFFCKLVTRAYDGRSLVKIHKKYNLRFFSYFRDKNTNEYFSIIKICNIKDNDLLNNILPDKTLKGKRKEEINQRLIDIKMNRSENILNFVKFSLVSYLVLTLMYIIYQANKYKSNLEKDEFE